MNSQCLFLLLVCIFLIENHVAHGHCRCLDSMTTYHGREFGSKIGSGGAATAELSSLQRKERLKSLLTETYDLKNDPYLYKNHIGAHECKLCGTVHRDEANYVDHTKGKRHQEELAKRQARLSSGKGTAAPLVEKKKIEPRKTEKIGRPAFKVLKQLDRETLAHSILFRVRCLASLSRRLLGCCGYCHNLLL